MMAAGAKKQDGKAERARRRAICAKCPHQSRTLIKVCKLCGCPIVSKTITGPCPDNRW